MSIDGSILEFKRQYENRLNAINSELHQEYKNRSSELRRNIDTSKTTDDQFQDIQMQFEKLKDDYDYEFDIYRKKLLIEADYRAIFNTIAENLQEIVKQKDSELSKAKEKIGLHLNSLPTDSPSIKSKLLPY